MGTQIELRRRVITNDPARKCKKTSLPSSTRRDSLPLRPPASRRSKPTNLCLRWLVLPLAFTSIAIGCGQSKSSSGGQTLRQQVDAALGETHPSRRASRLIRLAVLQHDAKDTRGAQQTMGFASRACKEITDDTDRARLLTLLVKAQVGIGDSAASDSLLRAEQAIAQIDDVESRLTGRAAWAEAQAALGDQANALQTLAAIETEVAQLQPSDKHIRVLCQVAESYDDNRVARSAEADRMIGEALLLAGAISDHRDRSRALTDIALTQTHLRREQAADTLQLAHEAARQIKSPWSRAHALHGVALAVADRGEALAILEEADATAEEVPEPDLRKQTRQIIRESIDQMRLGHS